MLVFSLSFSSCPSSENYPGNTRLLRDTAQFFKSPFSSVGSPHLSLSHSTFVQCWWGSLEFFQFPVSLHLFSFVHTYKAQESVAWICTSAFVFIITQFYLHIPIIITAFLLIRQYGYVFIKLFSLSICCY